MRTRPCAMCAINDALEKHFQKEKTAWRFSRPKTCKTCNGAGVVEEKGLKPLNRLVKDFTAEEFQEWDSRFERAREALERVE